MDSRAPRAFPSVRKGRVGIDNLMFDRQDVRARELCSGHSIPPCSSRRSYRGNMPHVLPLLHDLEYERPAHNLMPPLYRVGGWFCRAPARWLFLLVGVVALLRPAAGRDMFLCGLWEGAWRGLGHSWDGEHTAARSIMNGRCVFEQVLPLSYPVAQT